MILHFCITIESIDNTVSMDFDLELSSGKQSKGEQPIAEPELQVPFLLGDDQ